MTAATPFPIVARPLPAPARYRRLKALASELALLTAEAADHARSLEAQNLETLAEIYVEDARLFGALAAEAETAPRLPPLYPEERPLRPRLEGQPEEGRAVAARLEGSPSRALSPPEAREAAAGPCLSTSPARGPAAVPSTGGDAA